MSITVSKSSTVFQSTLSVRRATTCLTKQGVEEDISIHALRKESDAYCGRIMSPCSAFQSTLSVRRATQRILDAGLAMEFQSTLSVRRATQSIMARFGAFDISIHALRKESDPGTGRHQPHRHDFNPRSP